MTSRFLRTLLDDASRPFRPGGHFAYHYARGKLSSDCIFRELLKRGIFPTEGRFLDLGCGQGSLFAWLLAARKLYEQGNWPSDWAAAPKALSLRGYELMQKDVDRAVRAFGPDHPLVDIRQGDMCKVDFGQVDVVTILDALHYIDHARQKDVLKRIRAALPPGGLFLTRVGDKGAGLPYHLCNWVDHAVTFIRGHRLPTLYGRPLAEWIDLLKNLGFQVESMPMTEGKPFANIMLICRLPEEISPMKEVLGFLAGSALLLWFSRKALRAAGSHGFYRFFAWEAILLLVVLNHEPWGENPWSPQQVASWILMLLSILLASLGLSALRSQGQAGETRDDPALYGFEKTTALVSSGIFRYIRHPMYTSLIALAWGAFFQDPSLVGSLVALAATFFLLLTAKADEQECLQYFGEQYASYRQRTWMFIPFLL